MLCMMMQLTFCMHRLQSGGPYYQVELGRFDGRVSTRDSVRLPGVNFTLDQLNAFFSSLGFSQAETIALLGKRHRLLLIHRLTGLAIIVRLTLTA